jgi:SAM-dependent methyltransferase
MTPDDRWLGALWPFVRAQLPPVPARVVEIGCGPLGGFVPRLDAAGYEATGVDPEAPQEPRYRRVEFEQYEMPELADAMVACTSLHHVADVGNVMDLVEAALVPGGLLVVVEWARERFDEATARWCFDRLPPDGGDPNWLQQQRTEWLESGLPWATYSRSWAEAKGLHAGEDILRELRGRFGGGATNRGPYYFPDLEGISAADEQAAIDRGEIQANRIDYVGHRRSSPRAGRPGP